MAPQLQSTVAYVRRLLSRIVSSSYSIDLSDLNLHSPLNIVEQRFTTDFHAQVWCCLQYPSMVPMYIHFGLPYIFTDQFLRKIVSLLTLLTEHVLGERVVA